MYIYDIRTIFWWSLECLSGLYTGVTVIEINYKVQKKGFQHKSDQPRRSSYKLVCHNWHIPHAHPSSLTTTTNPPVLPAPPPHVCYTYTHLDFSSSTLAGPFHMSDSVEVDAFSSLVVCDPSEAVALEMVSLVGSALAASVATENKQNRNHPSETTHTQRNKPVYHISLLWYPYIHVMECTMIMMQITHKYSGPPILRPPIGPRKCGLILQVVVK